MKPHQTQTQNSTKWRSTNGRRGLAVPFEPGKTNKIQKVVEMLLNRNILFKRTGNLFTITIYNVIVTSHFFMVLWFYLRFLVEVVGRLGTTAGGCWLDGAAGMDERVIRPLI